ncbi:MAG: ABC transporter substrate-binding protein [Lachnospiraceae bacterium]|nr:ABC transporter substrate-binding protein [Lachnospiraceae bacterium]
MKKTWKKLLALTLSMGLAAGSLAACGGKDPVVETEPQQTTSAAAGGENGGAAETSAEGESQGTEGASAGGSTFTYAIGGDPGANVNVITTGDRFGLMTIKMVYSPLCMYNADGINWFLAESVDTSDDNMTYTFHLRDDVVWSDGEPFNADDVVFTYEAMEDPNNAGWAYSQLVYDQGATKIEKIDDYTVAFTLPFASAGSLEMLCNIFIMPEHLYKDVTDFENNDINTKPVGTGPYVMAEYSPGSHVKFEANDTYFLGRPDIDTFVFQIVENSNTAMMAIQSGEIDAWVATPAEVAQMDLEGNNLTTYAYSEGRVAYMAINVKQIPDEKVRKAIFYALNTKDINDAVYLSEDNYLTPTSFLPPISQFYTENVETYETDVDKAKELLKEAGAEGLKVTLTYSGSDSAQTTQATLIQQQLAQAGITCELNGMDSTAMFAQLDEPDNDIQMFLNGYIMGIDPDTFYPLFAVDGVYNRSRHEYAELDELFKRGRETMDADERFAIYEELQQVLQEKAFFYPLASNNRLLVVNKRVGGVDEAGLVPVYTFEDTSKLTLN